MPAITLTPITASDRSWIARFAAEHWGADLMVVHGTTYWISQLPGFIARDQGEVAGLITYYIQDKACEIVSIDSTRAGQGIGTLLLDAVKEVARQQGCTRLWLITTNDNLNALRFYQRRGFVLAALHPNVIAQVRKIKPQIPLIGDNDIPIRDEIELEWLFSEERNEHSYQTGPAI